MEIGEVPRNVRLLAELLAAQPRIARRGKTKIELHLDDGRLVTLFVNERVDPSELEQEETVIPP